MYTNKSSGNVALGNIKLAEYSETPTTSDKYVKVTSTSDLTNGQYLIVYEEGSVAFDGSLETLDVASNTIEVVINNNEIGATDATAAAEFTIDVTAGTLKSASGYYIGQTSDANGMATSISDAYVNTIRIDEDGNANIVSSGGAYLRYNSTSGQTRFRYFKSSTYTAQKAIQLYKKVENTPQPETIEVTISAAGYSTLYYGTKNLIVPEGVDAFAVTVASSPQLTRAWTYREGEVIPAGTGVVLKAPQGTYEFTVTDETALLPASNMLRGSDEAKETTGGTYYYALTLDKNGQNPGFYWMKDNGAAFTNGAHKAYMALTRKFSDIVGAKSFLALPGDDDTNGIGQIEMGLTSNDEIYNLAGQRVNKAQKGVYIVNGKKVVIR